MIGFFPDSYPDELLYSACARYASRTKYLNKHSAIIELFGKRGLSAIVDFPTRLEYFISILPEGHNYSVEQLINENTLLPFHLPFLPIERAKVVRSEMRQKDDNRIHTRLGARAKQIENPKYLRYCSYCVDEDREKYGETYWHRVHQLAGIVICPTHQCFLKNSSVQLGRISSSFFHDAETVLPAKFFQPVGINVQNKSHKILHKIACDAEWLLLNGNLKIGSEMVQERYFNTLLKKGYAYYNGRLKYTNLLRATQQFFPPEIFKIIGRVSDKENWIIVLTQIGNVDVTYHPVRHLLLLAFLGLSAKEFFEDFIEYKPFGSTPYPCLNLGSNHYGKFTIQECKIFDNISKDVTKQGIPIGIFSCACGFIYQRLGPDKSDEDKFRFDSIRQYGDLWERALANHWANLDLSLSEIGRRFGTTNHLIARHAIRLNLPMNTEGTRSLQGYNRHRNPKNRYSTQLQNYRNEWLKVCNDYPNLSRKQLLDKVNFLCLWLGKNDLEWFEKHRPAQVTAKEKREYLDWEKIDKTLSKKVKKLREEILSSKEFPVRICITEIIKRLGHKVWFDKGYKKLPITAQIVDESVETLENFMLRKIKWTTEKFIEEKRIPSINQFKTRANLRNKTSAKSIKIQRAIKKALVEITDSGRFSKD
jgi:hypothetical protein